MNVNDAAAWKGIDPPELARAESSPTVVNGVVYAGSENGWLYAFHLPGQ